MLTNAIVVFVKLKRRDDGDDLIRAHGSVRKLIDWAELVHGVNHGVAPKALDGEHLNGSATRVVIDGGGVWLAFAGGVNDEALDGLHDSSFC